LVNMTDQVNVQDAKTRLSELLGRVERGEDIVIARGGHPIARLSPLRAPARRELGFLPGVDAPAPFFEPLPDDELEAWEGARASVAARVTDAESRGHAEDRVEPGIARDAGTARDSAIALDGGIAYDVESDR
jgi:prevent-host-death family protein